MNVKPAVKGITQDDQQEAEVGQWSGEGNGEAERSHLRWCTTLGKSKIAKILMDLYPCSHNPSSAICDRRARAWPLSKPWKESCRVLDPAAPLSSSGCFQHAASGFRLLHLGGACHTRASLDGGGWCGRLWERALLVCVKMRGNAIKAWPGRSKPGLALSFTPAFHAVNTEECAAHNQHAGGRR